MNLLPLDISQLVNEGVISVSINDGTRLKPNFSAKINGYDMFCKFAFVDNNNNINGFARFITYKGDMTDAQIQNNDIHRWSRTIFCDGEYEVAWMNKGMPNGYYKQFLPDGSAFREG